MAFESETKVRLHFVEDAVMNLPGRVRRCHEMLLSGLDRYEVELGVWKQLYGPYVSKDDATLAMQALIGEYTRKGFGHRNGVYGSVLTKDGETHLVKTGSEPFTENIKERDGRHYNDGALVLCSRIIR